MYEQGTCVARKRSLPAAESISFKPRDSSAIEGQSETKQAQIRITSDLPSPLFIPSSPLRVRPRHATLSQWRPRRSDSLQYYFLLRYIYLFTVGCQVFEATLKEVVQAKRLSASKMTKLTEIAMKSLSVRWSRFLPPLPRLIVPLLSHVA